MAHPNYRLVFLLLAALLGGCRSVKTSPPIISTSADPVGVRFVDVAQSAGLDYRWVIPGSRPLTILQSMGWGCAFLDYDNDDNLDILLVGPKLALYKGDGHGHFTDVTHQVGLDRLQGRFMGCAVGDYDNDGFDDLYISGYHTGFLLHNEALTPPPSPSVGREENSGSTLRAGVRGFRDVTSQAGIKPLSWGSSAAFGDIDNDGKLDLYIGNYVHFGPDTPQLCNNSSCSPFYYKAEKGFLYRNLGHGRFQDVTRAWNGDKVTGKALGVAFADYNGSGHQSLMLANDGVPGDLLKNLGGKFLNIGSSSSVAYNGNGATQAGMGMDWGDYDNDGRLDLVLTNFENEPKPIYHNEGSDLFEDRSSRLGVAARTTSFLAFGVKWLDYDNDGWLDLMIANGHVIDNIATHEKDRTYRQLPQLFHNESGSRFTEVSTQAGPGLQTPIVGRGLVIGDYDNDGRVDVLMVDAEGTPLLLHNESTSPGHWLQLRLEGTRSNRDGYGALVRVTAGGRILTRLCHADGSYQSSSDRRIHIGLGTAATVESLAVRWSSGHTDTYKNVPADRRWILHEGDPKLRPLP